MNNLPPTGTQQYGNNVINQTRMQTKNIPLTGTQQYGNNVINQTSMQTKGIPPTPPPDSSSRCLTPSGIKPGIQYF